MEKKGTKKTKEETRNIKIYTMVLETLPWRHSIYSITFFVSLVGCIWHTAYL